MPRSRLAAACAVAAVACCGPALASPGDRSPQFLACVRPCASGCRSGATPDPSRFLQLLAWDCEDECHYRCMHKDDAARREHGVPQTQYHGKWAFTRVLGMQEIVSVFASAGNMLPHLLSLTARREQVAPQGYPFRAAILGFAAVGVMTWAASGVFHIRDVPVTELLDYAFANMLLISSTVYGICRVADLRDGRAQTAVAVVAAALFAVHVHTLWQPARFPYDYNMKVALLVGLSHAALWVAYGLLSKRRHARKAALAAGGSVLAAAFEVLDFPPLWGLVDAHALWHVGTIPFGFLFYKFVAEDAAYEAAAAAKRGGTPHEADVIAM